MYNSAGCDCDNCRHKLCVSKVPIFSGLSTEELVKVAGLINKKRYEKGEMIIAQGVSNNDLIIIDKGQVKAFKYNEEGKEQILYIFTQGDFFGEKNILKGRAATYNVEALESTSICMINKNDFNRLLSEHSNISIKIIEELSNRMEKIEDTVQSLGTKSVDSRINSILIEFSEKYGVKQKRGILLELPLSREGIANYIGTARETVSRKLSLLQDAGIIEMIGNKKILILNIKALK